MLSIESPRPYTTESRFYHFEIGGILIRMASCSLPQAEATLKSRLSENTVLRKLYLDAAGQDQLFIEPTHISQRKRPELRKQAQIAHQIASATGVLYECTLVDYRNPNITAIDYTQNHDTAVADVYESSQLELPFNTGHSAVDVE